MSMQEYPLSEKCALLVTPEAACAILLNDSAANNVEMEILPEPVRKALSDGQTPWDCANDPAFSDILAEGGWMSVPDAYDIMHSSARGIDGTIYCSEFTGDAVPASGDGFGDEGSRETRFDGGVIVLLVPKKEPSLFVKAYADKDELLREYESRLQGLVGPGFPYARYVVDVYGTYVC